MGGGCRGGANRYIAAASAASPAAPRPYPLLDDRSIIFWRFRGDRIYTQAQPSTRCPYVAQSAL
jgi:hypothetical protein